MAKFGEGDARWIVQKREDGTNVNAWHWSEKDVTGWSRRRLGELFDGAVLVDSPRIVATGLDSLGGEALLNNRKAKLVATYELKLSVGWRGSASSGAEVSGMLELPYVADENEDEDPEVRVTTLDEGPAGAELREALLRKGGREAVRKLVGEYVTELKSGAPLKGDRATGGQDGGPGDTAGDCSGAGGKPAAGGEWAEVAALAKAKQAVAANGVGGDGAAKAVAASRERLELEEAFYCRPADLFECLTSEGRLRAFTMSPASAEPRPGGKFSWFGGSVTGEFTALEPPSHLSMAWRFSSWAEGVASAVDVLLAEPEPGSTVLRLVQTGIPEEDAFHNHDVERGWQEQVFRRIKQVFGYGA